MCTGGSLSPPQLDPNSSQRVMYKLAIDRSILVEVVLKWKSDT